MSRVNHGPFTHRGFRCGCSTSPAPGAPVCRWGWGWAWFGSSPPSSRPPPSSAPARPGARAAAPPAGETDYLQGRRLSPRTDRPAEKRVTTHFSNWEFKTKSETEQRKTEMSTDRRKWKERFFFKMDFKETRPEELRSRLLSLNLTSLSNKYLSSWMPQEYKSPVYEPQMVSGGTSSAWRRNFQQHFCPETTRSSEMRGNSLDLWCVVHGCLFLIVCFRTHTQQFCHFSRVDAGRTSHRSCWELICSAETV